MKAGLKLLGGCSTGIFLCGTITLLVLQHVWLKRSQEENHALRQQAEQLTAEKEQLAEERKQLLAQPGVRVQHPQEPGIELLRLRGEVGRLRSLEKEAEQAQRAEMEAAKVALPTAEKELQRLAVLCTNGLVSSAEVEKARFAVELLKATAKGEWEQTRRIQLLQAEAELARASELHKRGLLPGAAYAKAQYTVELRRAELQGDAVMAGQIKLRQAEEELARMAELRARASVSEAEYNEAARRVEVLRMNTKR